MASYYVVTKIDRKTGIEVYSKQFESILDAMEYIETIKSDIYGYSFSKIDEQVIEFEV